MILQRQALNVVVRGQGDRLVQPEHRLLQVAHLTGIAGEIEAHQPFLGKRIHDRLERGVGFAGSFQFVEGVGEVEMAPGLAGEQPGHVPGNLNGFFPLFGPDTKLVGDFQNEGMIAPLRRDLV